MYKDNFLCHYLGIIQDGVNIKMALIIVNWEKLKHFAIFLQ